jgi:tRNA(His) guanylyltransferase
MLDPLGDRMKALEAVEAGRRLEPLLPVIARMDGRSFSAFTRGLARPYDERLSRLMVETTKSLVKETNARLGYTQSDEITLLLYSPTEEAQIYFDGRIHKMVSQLAAQTSAVFNFLLPEYLPEKEAARTVGSLPTFDARLFQVPSLIEATNAFLWREQDAVRNSVSMAARAQFSHRELMNKTVVEMREMLSQKGITWEDYPSFFQRGTYLQRRVTKRRFTTEELEALPERHNARLNPELEVERTDYAAIELPPLARIQNREGVVFFGEAPILKEAAP